VDALPLLAVHRHLDPVLGRWALDTPDAPSIVLWMQRFNQNHISITRTSSQHVVFEMHSGSVQVHTTARTFGNGEWFHLAWVMDRTNAQWHIYVNAVPVPLAFETFQFPTAADFTDCHLGRGSTHSGFFNGNLDDFRLYERAVSAAQVASAFHQKALNMATYGTTCPGLSGAPPGYETTPSGENLQACPINSFQDGSALKCTLCPAPGSFTAHGGFELVRECECAAGFSRAGTACEACAVGDYKQAAGDGECVICPPDMTTQAASSSSLAQCVCVVGSELLNGVCSACQAPAAKHNPGNGACINCGTGAALKPSEPHTPDACECQAGYAGARNACVACPEGAYATGPGAAQCVACASHATTSQPASASISDCFCAPPLLWEAAATGGPDVSGGVCVPTCAPGQHGAASSCAPCAQGSYKPAQGPQACTPCPAPRDSSRPGSVLATNCSCPAGHMLDPTGGNPPRGCGGERGLPGQHECRTRQLSRRMRPRGNPRKETTLYQASASRRRRHEGRDRVRQHRGHDPRPLQVHLGLRISDRPLRLAGPAGSARAKRPGIHHPLALPSSRCAGLEPRQPRVAIHGRVVRDGVGPAPGRHGVCRAGLARTGRPRVPPVRAGPRVCQLHIDRWLRNGVGVF